MSFSRVIRGRSRIIIYIAENENDRHEWNESIIRATSENYTLSRNITTGLDTRRIIFEYPELRFDAGRIAEQID